MGRMPCVEDGIHSDDLAHQYEYEHHVGRHAPDATPSIAQDEEGIVGTPELEAIAAAQKRVFRAAWECICDAASMNVVLSGPEFSAALRDFRLAIEAAAEARETRLREALSGVKRHLNFDGTWCWCDRPDGLGHDEACVQARAALAEPEAERPWAEALPTVEQLAQALHDAGVGCAAPGPQRGECRADWHGTDADLTLAALRHNTH